MNRDLITIIAALVLGVVLVTGSHPRNRPPR